LTGPRPRTGSGSLTLVVWSTGSRGCAASGGEEGLNDAFGDVPLSGEIEAPGSLGQEWGALLDDAEVAHLLAGPHLVHLNSL
jgi:hypothetical protein